MGSETACRGHIAEIFQSFPKADHGLNQRAIDSSDKQNYSSIELLLKPCVDECLAKLHGSHKVKGTRIYLSLMRDIRDSFFDKSLHSLCRLRKIWKSVFFLRIWRCWLKKNQYQEDTFFISNNAYMCTEVNAHMLLNLVYNVATGVFPPEALRIWCCGSQGCEQLFRILRAMTQTFSTIVNCTMQGILNRIHKLQFLSSAECDNQIIFPRVQKRLLQTNEESPDTLSTPRIEDITETIFAAKSSAIELAESCDIHFDSNEDKYFLKLKSVEEALQNGIENDGETNDKIDFPENQQRENVELEHSEAKEDDSKGRFIQIKLRKVRAQDSLPTYEHMNDLEAQGFSTEVFNGKEYSMSSSLGKKKFVLFNGVYIRKIVSLSFTKGQSYTARPCL